MNPFLERSFFIRWSLLRPEHVESAMETALADAQSRVDAVASQDRSLLRFDSTFLALEQATEALSEAWGKVTHLMSVSDSPALRKAHNQVLPKVTEFYARIPLREDLWAVLRAFADTPEAAALKGVRRRLLEETLADFRQHGADLPAPKKDRLRELQRELSELTQKFSENVLDATNGWELVLDDPDRLAGLPESAREAARRSALAKGLGTPEQPKWRFTLQGPSMEPFLTYLDDDALRRQMWEAAVAVGSTAPQDNRPLVRRILELRAEKAGLLGKRHFADVVLERRMARQGEAALAFVEGLHARIAPAFEQEQQELEEFRARLSGTPRRLLSPWEVSYWSEKLRRARYDFDAEQLRPYFPIDRVIGGLFTIAERVFGLRIVERSHAGVDGSDAAVPVETWHPEVKYYDLFDTSEEHLGSFFADWHPRESKRAGAWMNYLITGGRELGRQPHLGLICGNLTPALADCPAQLTHREVETIFHEFGHLLHHLLGDVEIKSLNGVNVAWDFVELPSQIMENWCWEREGLDLFARHAETGELIPQDLFDKMVAARNFRSASATMRQLAFARIDLLLHMDSERFLRGDLEETARAALRDYTVPTEPPAPSILFRFSHIFSDPVGYAAGYYSYKWAEVLDADAFTRFKREGIFNAETGREFRQKILSRGNAEDPMKLYVDFMGREPQLDPLLERSGLLPAQSS